MFWFFVVFIVSFLVLARSGALLVNALTGLARLLRLSEYMIAFMLMSFATSISELFVGISSGIGGISEFSLGNILGANLLNLTIVIGVAVLISGRLVIESKISRSNFGFIFGLALLPVLLGIDGVISRADGAGLILMFILYMWHVAEDREYFTKIANHHPLGPEAVKGTLRDLVMFGLGIVLLLVSSAGLVWSGKSLASIFSLGILSFGVLFVALGTTLPELTFGIRASLKNHGSMAVGNSLGSIAFNSAFIVGIVSLISPIRIAQFNEFIFVMGALIVAFILFHIFVHRKTDISRKEGTLLIAVYIVFFIFEILRI